MNNSIADQLDKMLENDKTFTTRAGLRFMGELVRDAFKYIEDGKEQNKSDDERLQKLEKKVNDIDSALTTFLQTRSREQEKAEEERKRWRWAFLTPTIVLVLTEVFRWLLGR